MEHAKVFARRGKAGDGVALPRRVGIARCRDHHPEGGAAVPVRLESIELSLDRPLDHIEQVAPEAQQDRLRFRIAEPAVEFQRARIARAVDHQTGVEEADVAVAFLGHSREHRLDHFAHDAGVQLGGHDGGGRIRAHAAGVGALIAVPEALVVLARGKRQHVFPVGKNNEARLLAFEEFLDHHPAARGPHGPLHEDLFDRAMGFFLGPGDDDAFPRGEPVGLDDDRRSALVDVRVCGTGFLEGRERRGGNAVARHEFLGELLRALQLRAGPGRPEDPQPLGLEYIDDAFGERRLGPDHGEVDTFGKRELGELAYFGDRDVLKTVFARGAAVSRRDEHLLHTRVLREAPRDRVLPASRADDEQLHQCRKCRTPVNTMARPSSSAAAITSSSRTLPPGWITAFAPARATTSMPSRNGKKASDATADPASECPASFALRSATRAASTRLIWPAPTASVRPSLQNTIAFDLAYFATRHANNSSPTCPAAGLARVTARNSEAFTPRWSGVGTKSPPPMRLKS